eukprot:Seg4360.1 transcript_id=Seg4360.1/GoldUCD/mRNA.D3Y31 product="hypothetical protein" protein_id=Seg4360.1/GoldUCD/D3Y31
MTRLLFIGLLLCIINMSCSKSVHRRNPNKAMNSDNADDDGIEERGFHVNRHYEECLESVASCINREGNFSMKCYNILAECGGHK